jgi:uncharacterized surface protein with fasciclin (FAS1) repeats
MKKLRIFVFSPLAILAFLMSSSQVNSIWEPRFSSAEGLREVPSANENRSVLDLADNSNDLTTLSVAIRQAGLADALQAEGPYTVFAPTNSAFEALPQGTLESLLRPENNQELASLLAYHVLPAEIMSEDIFREIEQDGGQYGVRTVAGRDLILERNDDGQVIVRDESGNTANVVTADVDASNGVVHIIDRVLLPSSDNSA